MLILKNVILGLDLTSKNNILELHCRTLEVWVLEFGMVSAIQNPRLLMRHSSRVMLLVLS